MRRKKNKASKSVNLQVLPLIHPNAAGIDVGAKEHVVAVPCDRDPRPVRTFQAFTPDLHELVAWLKRCRIETVALETYRFNQTKIQECDCCVQQHLAQFES